MAYSYAAPAPLFSTSHQRSHSPALSSNTAQSYSTLFASGLHNDVDELGRRPSPALAAPARSREGKKKGFLAKTLSSLVGGHERRKKVQMPLSPPLSPPAPSWSSPPTTTTLRPPRKFARPRSGSVHSGASGASGLSGVSGEGKAARVLGFASQTSLPMSGKAERVLGVGGGGKKASAGSLRSAKESVRSYDERARPPPRAPEIPSRLESLPTSPPYFSLPAAPPSPRSLSPASVHSRGPGPPPSWRSPSPFTISDRLSWSAEINIGQAALEELEQKELRRLRKPNPISWYTTSSRSASDHSHAPPVPASTWYSDHTTSRPNSNQTSVVEDDYPFAPPTTSAKYASFPISTYEPDDALAAIAPIPGSYSFLSTAPPPLTHWSPSSTPTSSLRRPSLPISPTRSHTPLSPTRHPPLPFESTSVPSPRQRTNTLISSASSGTRRYQRSNALNALEGRPRVPRPPPSSRRPSIPIVETRASKPFLNWSDDDADDDERGEGETRRPSSSFAVEPTHPYQRPGSVQSNVSMGSFRSQLTAGVAGEIDLFPKPPPLGFAGAGVGAGRRRERSERKASEESFLKLN